MPPWLSVALCVTKKQELTQSYTESSQSYTEKKNKFYINEVKNTFRQNLGQPCSEIH
jgi:hypothetical protein